MKNVLMCLFGATLLFANSCTSTPEKPVQDYLDAAEIAHLEGNYPLALTYLDSILHRADSVEAVWQLHALSLHEMDSCSKAVTSYDKAIALAPEKVGHKRNKAICYLRMQEAQKALDVLDLVLASDSVTPLDYYYAARADRMNKNPDKNVAYDFITQAMRMDTTGYFEEVLLGFLFDYYTE